MTVKQELFSIIETYNSNKVNHIGLETSLKKDLKLDSLSLTELLVECEEHFNIEIDIDETDAPYDDTVNSLYSAILQLTGQYE